MDIKIQRTTKPKTKPDQKALGFGKYLTDHMFLMDYNPEQGWHDFRIVPYGPIPMEPDAVALHLRLQIARSSDVTDRSAFTVKRRFKVGACGVDTAQCVGIGLTGLCGGVDKGGAGCVGDPCPSAVAFVVDAVFRGARDSLPADFYALGGVVNARDTGRVDITHAFARVVVGGKGIGGGVQTAHGIGVGLAGDNACLDIRGLGGVGDPHPSARGIAVHAVQLRAGNRVPADGDAVFVQGHVKIRCGNMVG